MDSAALYLTLFHNVASIRYATPRQHCQSSAFFFPPAFISSVARVFLKHNLLYRNCHYSLNFYLYSLLSFMVYYQNSQPIFCMQFNLLLPSTSNCFLLTKEPLYFMKFCKLLYQDLISLQKFDFYFSFFMFHRLCLNLFFNSISFGQLVVQFILE